MELQVVEGLSAVWHYHLAHKEASSSKALCGAKTMSCGLPVTSWGFKPGHMRSSYCAECASIGGITSAAAVPA